MQSGDFTMYLVCVFLSDVSKPAFFEIMAENERHFCKFITTQDEINDHRRQFENECCEEAEWNKYAPHFNKITDKAEFRITAGTEDAADEAGVHRTTDNIYGADPDHGVQIFCSLLCKCTDKRHDRVAAQN